MKKVVLILAVVFSTMTQAQEHKPQVPQISVTGEGKIKVVPDRAIISVGVLNTGKDSYDLIPGLPEVSFQNESNLFISQQEINGILMVCKRFKVRVCNCILIHKLYFSRKCAERPFESVISILSKIPWHQTGRITLLQRDHLFEMFKSKCK
jgi:hypothetical protein